jgi:hypothetical protein
LNLDPVDATELGELLQLIRDWLAVDPALRASLATFIGHPAYNVPELQADLDRFTFLLGGNDGVDLRFATDPNPF